MSHRAAAGIVEGRTIAVCTSRGDRVDGTVVRSRDDLVIVAVGVARSREWKLGDHLNLVSTSTKGRVASTRVRIYSMYRALGADHVALDLAVRGHAPTSKDCTHVR
jgi:hypothetical protein